MIYREEPETEHPEKSLAKACAAETTGDEI